MRVVIFEVIGIPAPQGSKTVYRNGGMKESSKAVKPWRDSVAAAARDQAANLPAPLDGPLSVAVTFRFPMPKSRPAAVRAEGRAPKSTAPDIDKLLRSTFDAITTSGLWHDDARVAYISAGKFEVVGWTGAKITVTTAGATA